MNSRAIWMIGIVTLVIILGLLGLTLVLAPNTSPAFDVAVDFMNMAGQGDDTAALPLLNDTLQAYVAATCPNGSVSACVRGYTPQEWGGMMSAVFRRAIPDGGDAWDILVVATYQAGQGFSGVCTYYRVERDTAAAQTDTWRIARWAGFVSCDEPHSGLTELRDSADAPNRAP